MRDAGPGYDAPVDRVHKVPELGDTTHSGKDNAMANMLSRARFDDESGMVSEDEDVGVDFFEAAHLATERGSTPTLNEFDESEYDGEWL
jgi:hypothetical protein